jgi:hypothetical protein
LLFLYFPIKRYRFSKINIKSEIQIPEEINPNLNANYTRSRTQIYHLLKLPCRTHYLAGPTRQTYRQRDRERRQPVFNLRRRETGEAAVLLGQSAEGSAGGEEGAGEGHGIEARPKAVAARCEVSHGLLTMCAGGCDHDHPRPASTGGGGPRKKGSASTSGPMRIRGIAQLSSR